MSDISDTPLVSTLNHLWIWSITWVIYVPFGESDFHYQNDISGSALKIKIEKARVYDYIKQEPLS